MSRPNLLLIVIDDMGWRDLSCYGSTFYETPRLDQLAREGLRFTDAYASCPVCSPTRASLMSGKYPARLGITHYIEHALDSDHCSMAKRVGRLTEAPYLHYLPKTEVSLGEALRQGGYQTWHVGKWHLGDARFHPDQHGFEVNIGGCHYGMPKHGYWSPWKIPNLPEAPAGTYLTDHLTDLAIRQIKGRDRTRPFFLNWWHYAVHTPIQAPAALVEKYRQKARALKLDQLDPIVVGEEMPVLPAHWEDQRQMGRVTRRMFQSDPVYAAMMENLDTNIGRLLDCLAAEGVAEDTVVAFTSDNGGLATAEGAPTCNAPLAEGKGWYRDGGTRVCQMIRWPKRIRDGLETAAPVQSCDIYPTFLACAGLPLRPQQHCDGVSLTPLFTGQALAPRALFWHFPHYANQGGQPAAWVLRDGWKLIHRYELSRDELFHLPSDISEARDRAAELPDLVASLRAELDAWQRDVQARHPSGNPDWERLRALVPEVENNALV